MANTPFVPVDGRITSLQTLNTPLAGAEAMYIVSPGNAQFGNSYQVQTALLAAFFAAFPALNRETITAGATVTSPYQVETSDTQVFFNKTIGSASYAVCPLASSMIYPNGILFKDFKGDAFTNNITISFTGGQTCDGLSEIQIKNAFGWVWLAPGPSTTGATGWCVIG